MTDGQRDPVKVGVAIADMSAFEAVDPAYGIGDQRAQVEAAVAAARARGELPVRGHDVELVFRTFHAVDVEHKRAVADEFAADGVLAVIGARDFTYGAVALAERHGVPVIDVNALPSTVIDRCAPWLFTLRCAQEVTYRTFVRWAHREVLLGKRIGMFTDRYTRGSAEVARAELARLGHEVCVHVDSDGLGYGSDQDEVAIERFRAADVDTVLPFVSGSSLVELLRAAADGYAPRVVDLETGEHTADVTASLMAPDLYDGTLALATNRVGEAATNGRLDPVPDAAVAAYESASGTQLARWGRDSSGALSNVLLTADLVNLLVLGLQRSTEPLDRRAFVAGLETITGQPAASAESLTFAPGMHWGARRARPVRWDAGRGVWLVQGPWEPVAEA